MSARIAMSRLGANLESLESRSLPSVANLSALGVLRITGTTAADDITVRQADGSISIDDTSIVFGGTSHTSVPATSVRRIEINSLAGDDIIFLGAAGQEVSVRTVVNAGAGNDWAYTGLGNDTVSGGYGDDQLFASTGIDAVYGGYGHDFLDDGDRDRFEMVVGGFGFDWNADVVAIQGTTAGDVKQRESPTCSFLASVSGLAGMGYKLREWITYDGVNGVGVPVYSVGLWNGTDWVWQSVEFDGTLFTTDTAPAAEGESWVVLMNRAWIAFHGGEGEAFPHEALTALVGPGFEIDHFDYTTSVMPDTQLDFIIQTINDGGLIIAGTGGEARLASGVFVANHAYTVFQVFRFNGEVWLKLRNPMGVDGGSEISGSPNDGFVFVTWDEFQESMTYLAAF